MFDLDEVNKDNIEDIFDLFNVIKTAVIQIAEEREPDWVFIEGPVWFSSKDGVFKVANTYHPGCNCCEYVTGITDVSFEKAIERVKEDKIHINSLEQ